MKKKSLLCIYFGIILFNLCTTSHRDSPAIKGLYFGQKPPGDIPELFAPGIISTGHHESKIIFSPDGKEAYYNMMHLTHNYNAIIFRKQENGKWSSPQVVPFSGKYMDSDPFFSIDGRRLFFTSKRPLNEKTEHMNYDLWVVERIRDSWSEPRNMGGVINTDKTDVNPCVTGNNNLYFSSNRDGGFGLHDIYIARYVNGEYKKPENLGDSINTAGFESSPYVSPDESYMIFNAFRGDIRGLHISYKKEDGTWTKATYFDKPFGSHALLTTMDPDGKYLFFGGRWEGKKGVFWVDSDVIEDVKSSLRFHER